MLLDPLIVQGLAHAVSSRRSYSSRLWVCATGAVGNGASSIRSNATKNNLPPWTTWNGSPGRFYQIEEIVH